MGGNACDDVFDWAGRDPGRAMFAVKADGTWPPVTAEQVAGRVTAVAAGLIAAGIGPGDRVGDGFLYLTGRKKDLIITAGGKNVAPEVLEDRLREHWLIQECVVVGDQRPYIAALVTLDQAAFAR
jgi:long-subunit acyl-CoA synthetase (AMP-forming)